MKDTELIRAKGFGIATFAYSFNNLVRFVYVAANINDFRFISLDTIRVSRGGVFAKL